MKMIHETHEKHKKKQKKISVIHVTCGFFFNPGNPLILQILVQTLFFH
jgi:hypothetical protein